MKFEMPQNTDDYFKKCFKELNEEILAAFRKLSEER